MAHNVMEKFRLSAIAAVDNPAQRGARAVIMKRDAGTGLYLAKAAGAADLPEAVEAYLKRNFSDDKRKELASSGAALPDGSFPIENRSDLENAIRAIGRAKDPAKAKSHIIARARSLDATSMLPPDWRAGKSIGGELIMEINRVAPRALPDLLDNVVKAEEMQAQVAKLSDAKIRKSKLAEFDQANAAVVASAWSTLDSASPDDMVSLLQKNFAEYKDHIAGLLATSGDDMALKDIAKLYGLPETATEAEIIKAAEADKAKIKAAEAEAEKTKKRDALLAKMSDKHQAFMNNPKAKLPDGGKDAFMEMEPAARDAHMEKNPIEAEDDPDAAKNCIKLASGKTIRKRDVGEATFAVLQEQQADIQKGIDRDAIATIEKRVSPLKFVIGKAADSAALLHRIAKACGQKDADAVEALLSSANTVMAKSETITKEFGRGGGNGGIAKAIDGINAKAAELMKADPKLRIEKARTMVRTMHPDLAKQEQDEAADARKAA